MVNNKAIALCRVSTQKQRLEGSSLEAQSTRVYKCAVYLETEIVKLWSHDISSRKGKNLARKDLHEMFEYAKKDKKIKYIIVDEADRFMRSMEEAYWWKVQFSTIGVKLAYANMPEITHVEDPMSVMREMMAFFQAEASNHERITKTTDKMQAKIEAGLYPGMVHQGYMKSSVRSLHVPREPQWSLLQQAMNKILYESYTLSETLKWLNDNGYRLLGGGKLDMFKLRRILIQPYYAGIIKMSNWEVVCEKGLHKAMITIDEHNRLVDLVSGKRKKFTVHKYNPLFLASNIIECDDCLKEGKPQARLVGYRHHNNKPIGKRRYYERYRCRGCGKNVLKQVLHDGLDEVFSKTELIMDEELFMGSLRKVWKSTAEESLKSISSLNKRLSILESEKNSLIRSMVSNPELVDDIKQSVTVIKKDIHETRQLLDSASNIEEDFDKFAVFATEYIDNIKTNWWTTENAADRIRFKQLVYPDGITISRNGKVLTPRLSPIYRYERSKKTPEGVNSDENISIGGPAGT